ncbi:MAG TPA: PAS domain-containing sensor histidine kinase [Chloroflexota bacterium]|nr:PAS domain-containing sensor histidine kinase [Chloroflexota bacterium]
MTERHSASRRAQDVNLRHILTAIADGVVVVDREGTVCFANPASEALFGRRAGELIGDQFGFPLVAGATTDLEVVGRSGRPATVEMQVVQTIWEGQRAWLASLRDITERKRAEAERAELYRVQAAREEAERALQARDEFLAVAAHELKTPLTRLRLSTQRALRHIERVDLMLPVVVADALLLVDRESEHIDRLVTQLLDLSRIENGTFSLSPAETDLVPLVEGVVAHLRGAGQPELAVRLPREPLLARVDPRVFGQVVASLVANAVRYSPPDSRVEIELVRDDRAAGGREARLAVLDRAPMAGLEYEPGLFDRPVGPLHSYFAGTGIGLYVSRRMVELQGGRVEVERVGGEGARIVVAVPVAA